MAIEERKTLSDDDISTVSVRRAARPGSPRTTVAERDADQGDVDGTDTGDVDGTDAGGGDRGNATDRGDQTDRTDTGDRG